jgi:hypothetical protein
MRAWKRIDSGAGPGHPAGDREEESEANIAQVAPLTSTRPAARDLRGLASVLREEVQNREGRQLRTARQLVATAMSRARGAGCRDAKAYDEVGERVLDASSRFADVAPDEPWPVEQAKGFAAAFTSAVMRAANQLLDEPRTVDRRSRLKVFSAFSRHLARILADEGLLVGPMNGVLGVAVSNLCKLQSMASLRRSEDPMGG